MMQTYTHCTNLTGEAVCGPNVTSMLQTYWNCPNIGKNSYFYSNNVTNVYGCFGKRNESRRLNLYVPNSGNTIDTILHGENKASSLIGEDILYTYVNDEYDPYYVNTNKNVYIYPVSNVIETRNEHKHLIVSYTSKNTSTRPTIETTYGNNSYTAKINGNYIKLLKNDTNAKISRVSFLNNKNITGIRELSNTVTNMANSFQNCINLTGAPVCGENVTNMGYTYANCYNLIGAPVCGDNVTDMFYAYFNCRNLSGNPVCGPNVTDMNYTYHNCINLTGSPVCGDNVTDMVNTYGNCRNLVGSPVCGDKVTNMTGTYSWCLNLTGNPVCGDKVVDFNSTYFYCQNLTGAPVCGLNITSLYQTYARCSNLTGSPVCGPNVTDMYCTYSYCHNITGSPVCGNNVIDMTQAYQLCYNLTGQPVCGPNVTNMHCTYYNCFNLTGSPVCGNKVVDLSQTYQECNNLIGSPVCENNVINMNRTYYNCYKLTGSPVCGDNVTDMNSTYYRCTKLTGSPVCGPNVTTMSYTYFICTNLTGSPVCGDKVTTMSHTYFACYNLTGSPVCGPNVTSMVNTYANCYNLTGPVLVESNVTNMYYTYYGCNNIVGCNVYIASADVSNARNCFYSSNSLNIYVPANSQTLNTFSASNGYIKGGVWWNWNNTGNYYYNNSYDLRIIPIDNVIQLYKENELAFAAYATTNTAERPVSMTGAVNGYGASINGNNVKLYKNDESDIITYMSFKNSQTITSVTNMTNSITDMRQSFYNCRNLTKAPMCGNNVTTMDQAFFSCSNLKVPATIGFNVTTSWMTYCNCYNIGANAYFFSHKVNNAQSCFGLRDTSKRLNIYVPQQGYSSSYNTLGTCLYTNDSSLIGQNITWTNDITTNGCYYNTAQNIYIYPVDNSYQSYKENELLIAKYTVTNASSAFLPVYDKEETKYHNFDTGSSQPWYSDYTEVRYDFLKYNFDAFVSLKIDDTTTENNFYREITRQEMLNNPDGVIYENSLAKIIVLNDNGTIILKIDPYDWADVRFRTSINYKVGYNYKNKYTVEDITNDDNTITRSVYVKDYNDQPPYLDFRGKTGLISVDILKMDTPENTSHMFEGCTNLETVNLSELDLNKIKIADFMFADCSKLTKESFDKLELPNIESAASIFRNCPNLQ
jgi:hypothetical protein